MSMFTSDAYNKYNKNTRIANWTEELALEAETGEQRRPTLGGFATRTVKHRDHEESKDWISVSHATHDHPLSHTDFIAQSRVGPLQSEEEKTRFETVRTLQSTNRADFLNPGPDAFAHPQRLTQDKKPAKFDPSILAAHGLRQMPCTLPEETIKRALPEGGLQDSVPVTMYTQRLGEGVFFGSAPEGANPFSRTAKTTESIYDGRKPHEQGVDHRLQYNTGVRDHPVQSVGSGLTLEPMIEEYRDRFQAIAGPSGLRGVLQSMRRLDTRGCGRMNRSEFWVSLIDLGLKPKQDEVQTFFAYLDPSRTGEISYESFLDVFMRTVSPTRQETMESVFRFLAGAPKGAGEDSSSSVLPLELLQTRLMPRRFPQVLQGTVTVSRVVNDFRDTWGHLSTSGQVTLADFSDYFCSLSYLIREDGVFDQCLNDLFGMPPPPPPELRKLLIYNLRGQPRPFEFKDVDGIGQDPVLIQSYLRTRFHFNDIDYVKIVSN